MLPLCIFASGCQASPSQSAQAELARPLRTLGRHSFCPPKGKSPKVTPGEPVMSFGQITWRLMGGISGAIRPLNSGITRLSL